MPWPKLRLLRDHPPEPAPAPEPAEQRAGVRHPVFREAQLVLEDYYKVRAVITDLSETGAQVRYSTRIDLPTRLRIAEPTLKLNCWARVVWQRDGSAGLEFVRED